MSGAQDTIGVGIVGAGFFGSMIARALSAREGIAVRVVSDFRAESAAELAGQYGAQTAADAEALAAHPGVDLVVVATPNHLHAAPAISALRAGKHVFVEKPLAITREDVEAIMAAAEGAPGRLIVGHIERCIPGIAAMLDAARSGELGEVTEVFGTRRRLISAAGGAAQAWKADASLTGGEVLHEIHELDLVCWALGSVASATTVAAAPAGAHAPTADGAPGASEWVTTLVSDTGALGLHTVATSAHRAQWSFSIGGTHAALEADFRAGTVTRYEDGRATWTGSLFHDEEADDSLRAAAAGPQAYNKPGSAGPVWMQRAVEHEMEHIERAVREGSSVLTQLPDLAVRAALGLATPAAHATAQEARA